MFSSPLQKSGFSPGMVHPATISNLLVAAAMVGGAGVMLSSGSAQAASSCDFGGFGLNNCTITTVLTAGDKKLSLKLLPTLGAGTIDLAQLGLIYSVRVGFDNGTGTLLSAPFSGAKVAYDLEVTSGTNYFSGVQLTVDGPGGGSTVVKSETSTPVPLFPDLTSIASFPAPPVPGAFQNIPGKVTKLSILDTYSATVGGLSSFTNSYRQSEVPGPLPLMGAGMAFGFSRKLRSRIKSRASTKA